MSKQIFETTGLYVSRHVGPASEGGDRQRWQLTTTNGEGYVVLTRRQVRSLIIVLLRDAWRLPRPTEDA